MYMVMEICKEVKAERENIIDISLVNENVGLVGMMPVFETEEAARKIYPNKVILPIEYKDKKTLD